MWESSELEKEIQVPLAGKRIGKDGVRKLRKKRTSRIRG
jgi:hypothetical protein